MMAAMSEPTIKLDMLKTAECKHCSRVTVQVEGLVGDPLYGNYRCLQCIADGGTCCTLAGYNRWPGAAGVTVAIEGHTP